MTRTAVRRHVDVNDGRVVIRKIVVETSGCRDIAPTSHVPTLESAREPRRARRPRRMKPGTFAVRRRERERDLM